MTSNKNDKVTFAVAFTGEHFEEGKKIEECLKKLEKREKNIGKTSPKSALLREALNHFFKSHVIDLEGKLEVSETELFDFHSGSITSSVIQKSQYEKLQSKYTELEAELSRFKSSESPDIVVDTEKDPIKEGFDEYCYFIKGIGWFSSINRHGLKLGTKNGIPNFIPHPIVLQQWKAHQTEKIFLKTILGKKKLTKGDIEQLNDDLRVNLIIQKERGWLNNPELKKEAQTIIEKEAYGYMQSELRKYDEDRKRLIEEKWNLEEELKSLKETDLGELLEKEQRKNANLESQLKDNKEKIEKQNDQIKSLLSENENLRPYKNENFNLKQQITDLKKSENKLEPQITEKEIIKEIPIENPLNNELIERVKELEIEIRKAMKEAEDWWLCYNLSGGDIKVFQTLAREKFPQRFASDIDEKKEGNS